MKRVALMKRKPRPEGFRAVEYFVFSVVTLAVMLFCISLGSAAIPIKDALTAIWNTVFSLPVPEGISQSVIVFVVCRAFWQSL
jgi:hypothetical protein